MDRNAIRKIVQCGAVHGLDMTEARLTVRFSPCVERTTTNTPMSFQAILKSRLSVVFHTNIAGMKLLSVYGATYFVAIIDEWSRHLSLCHMKTSGEADEILK